MKTAFKYIGLGLLAVIVLVMLIATTKPNEFRVERSRTIAAPADSLQLLLTDFHAWTRWSPYEALDPDMKRTYSGMPNGVGAVYSWEGKKAGSGRMEILSVAPGGVRIALDFTEPMTAHNTAEFLFEPQGNATKVTWAMYGANNFVSKMFSVFVSMDKIVGKDFETGLANMEKAASH